MKALANLKNAARGRYCAGFTLIELLVVLVLMSLITLVFLNRQSKFDSATLMRSLAYSIALSVRQAQLYGVAVRPGTTAGDFTAPHGLSFRKDEPKKYLLFADVNNDQKYTEGVDTIDQTFSIGGGYAITEICATKGLVRRCSGANDSDGTKVAHSLVVRFVRPNPDAQIYIYKDTGDIVNGLDGAYSNAYVQVSSVSGDKRFISITNTGQVSVCSLGAAIGTGC